MIEDEILLTIFRLDNMVRRMNDRIAGMLGATQQQWAVLEILNLVGPTGIPLTELGRDLDVTKGNVTGLVDRMERDGMLKRKDDPRDRRVVRAIITAKGKKVLRDIQPVKDQLADRIFKGFGSREKRTLAKLLGQLLDRVIDLES